jgi:hypothetical protein
VQNTLFKVGFLNFLFWRIVIRSFWLLDSLFFVVQRQFCLFWYVLSSDRRAASRRLSTDLRRGTTEVIRRGRWLSSSLLRTLYAVSGSLWIVYWNPQ